MAGFDPDAYLQKKRQEGGGESRPQPFDPDSYLQPAGPFAQQTEIPMQGAEVDNRALLDKVRSAGIHAASATPIGAALPRGSLEALSEVPLGLAEGRGLGQSMEDAGRIYREAQASEVPTPSAALRRGGIQGATLGFRDELAGGLSALTGTLQDKAKKVAQGDFTGVTPEDMVSLFLHYQRGVNESRAKDDAARAAHPKTFLTGEIAGGAVIPGGAAAKSGSLLARGARTALASGGVGAVQSFGTRREGLEGAGRDAMVDGLINAGVGLAGPLLGQGLSSTIRALPESLKAKAAEKALQAAGYIGNDFKRLIKNRGQRGAQQMGRELLDADVIPAGGTVQDVLERIERAKPQAGAAVGEFVDRAAETGGQFDVRPFVERAQREIVDANANSPAVAPLTSEVQRLLGEHSRVAQEMGGSVPFDVAQRWKSDLQGVLNYGNPMNNAGPSIKASGMEKQLASILRNELDDQVESALGPGAAQQFQSARRRYGALADAEDRAKEGAARLQGNASFGLRDLSTAGALGPIVGAQQGSVAGMTAAALGAVGSKLARERGPSTLARGYDAAADLAATPGGTRFRQLAAALAESGAITPSAARALIAEREAEEARSRPETP